MSGGRSDQLVGGVPDPCRARARAVGKLDPECELPVRRLAEHDQPGEVLANAPLELDPEALCRGDRAQTPHTGLVDAAVQAVILVGRAVELHAVAADGDLDRPVVQHARGGTVDEGAPQGALLDEPRELARR